MNKIMVYKAFGIKLRNARKTAELTQVDLAERVGLSRTSITNIEKGRQGIPLHVFLELASAVGVKPVELIPDSRNFVEQEFVDRKILEKDLKEEEGLGWAARIISSGMKEEGNDGKD